jgi:CO dehydrogenase maturation factor
VLIAVVGKGGVGKTTVTALVVRRLLDARHVPLLAVDADPSNCLGPALGLAVERTLADLRDGMRETPDRPASMSHAEWLAIRAEEALIENNGFDLLTMGHPEGAGCYCFVNNVIRDYLGRLTRSYRHVIVDCEAGLEHLSRRTAGKPDRLVCVVGRAKMSADTVRRALAIYAGLHKGALPQLDLVLNGFDEADPLAVRLAAAAAWGDAGFARTFTVPWDARVSALDAAGRSLLDLEPSSPALGAMSGWEGVA